MSLVLLPLKIILVSLDFLIMLVTFGWVPALKKMLEGKKMRSVAISPDVPSHRVNMDHAADLDEGTAHTMYEVFTESFKKFSDRECMKSREYKGMYKEKPPIKHFGDIETKTYADVQDVGLKFGAALKKVGLVSAPEVATIEAINTPCSLAIFENSCPQWMMATVGAFSQSIIVTTIYATLGMEAVVDAVDDAAISAILCNQRNVANLLKRKSKMPTLKTIIYTRDNIAASETIDMPTPPAGVTVYSFEDFVKMGDTTAFPVTPPKSSSCAVVMYTSGSTGKPKGVILSHYGIVSAVRCADKAVDLKKEDVYIAYLPLAHIFEMGVEFSIMAYGGCMCYACPKTLTQKGSYPLGALEQYSPTLMAGVPKVWDIIKKGAEAKINGSKPIAKFLVQTAFQTRQFANSMGYDTPLFKALVFKKFSKLVGGKLRMAMSGGGPLNSEVQKFIHTAFGCPFIQGYGLTETVASLSIQALDDSTPGVVGPPTQCVEVKLKSTPDITDKAGVPYLSTDKHDVDGNVVYGRGEVCVKGSNVLVGYYKMPEETNKVKDKDGFFSTGDVGQFMEDGSIRIVDRVKNLVKLKGGEYIAFERMEMTYGNCKYVDAAQGGIMCYGDGDMDRPIALMHLNETVAKEWASANGNVSLSSDEMKKEVMNAMLQEWKLAGLSHLEKLVAIAFLDDVWTPENGCLTAANKLQRKAVIAKFADVFEATKKKGIF